VTAPAIQRLITPPDPKRTITNSHRHRALRVKDNTGKVPDAISAEGADGVYSPDRGR
jgi:hypothetical protein